MAMYSANNSNQAAFCSANRPTSIAKGSSVIRLFIIRLSLMKSESESPVNPLVSFYEVAFFLFFALQPHTHIDKDDYNKNNGECQNTIAYHKLLISVQTMCHNDSFKISV